MGARLSPAPPPSHSPSLTTNILESDKHCTPLNLNNQSNRRKFNQEKKLVQAPKNQCRDPKEAWAIILQRIGKRIFDEIRGSETALEGRGGCKDRDRGDSLSNGGEREGKQAEMEGKLNSRLLEILEGERRGEKGGILSIFWNPRLFEFCFSF